MGKNKSDIRATLDLKLKHIIMHCVLITPVCPHALPMPPALFKVTEKGR